MSIEKPLNVQVFLIFYKLEKSNQYWHKQNFLILNIQKSRGRQIWAGTVTQRCHQPSRLLSSCYIILSMWPSSSWMQGSCNISRHQPCIPERKELEGQKVGGQEFSPDIIFHFVLFLHTVITTRTYFLCILLIKNLRDVLTILFFYYCL